MTAEEAPEIGRVAGVLVLSGPVKNGLEAVGLSATIERDTGAKWIGGGGRPNRHGCSGSGSSWPQRFTIKLRVPFKWDGSDCTND